MTNRRTETPSFSNYLQRVSYQRLSPAAMTELCATIAAGDRCRSDAALRRLVEANLPLVVTIAKRYWFEGVFVDDLVQAGNLGLLRAARTFDPSRAASFSTWATFSIKNELLEFLAENQHGVRLPRQVHDRVMGERRQLGEVRLDTAGGRAARAALSIDAEDAAGFCIAERLASSSPVVGEAEAGELRRILLGLVDQLREPLRDVIVVRYGLDGAEPVGTVEQARRLGLTREAVRQRHRAAIEQLRILAVQRELQCWSIEP